ncbi:jacalin-like lectin [Nonomuraea turcica]|uniref:jacalin-like lectin n=1 Tax=Nonomuraea sp. G32 TaxID=3067274 RepID=UPI00273CB00F|nr:jacalin-like lectin [Nonomuraea sp. G32]MDP4502601.1 jacalin-like lectin [Nonomuraea sp. G32]
MRIVRLLPLFVLLVAIWAPLPAHAASGTFSLLSYNIAGLPDVISGGDPATNTPIIGARLAPYDIVHVQEDFNYHAALYAADNHPYRTPTSGGVPFGSGLNTLSGRPYDADDFERVTWSTCSIGSGDCLTPKGFTFMRVRLAAGVYAHLYNLHADAGSESGDLAARRANLLQLSAFIQSHSAGHPVIVYGDTNTRYTRTGDNIRDLLAQNGLADVWVQHVRGGTPPEAGSPALVCDDAAVTNACEVVDKILYRSGSYVMLTATGYNNDNAAFRDAAGAMLSDHYPISTSFSWSLNPSFQLSEQFGGPHGTYFTDVVPARARAIVLSLQAGSRVDRIGLTQQDGTVLAHGGTGGTARTLALGADEYASSLYLCRGVRNEHTRIFYARFTTNLGRTLAGGSTTSDCTTFAAPAGWQIAGFHGRSGAELDKVGVIYTQR